MLTKKLTAQQQTKGEKMMLWKKIEKGDYDIIIVMHSYHYSFWLICFYVLMKGSGKSALAIV